MYRICSSSIYSEHFFLSLGTTVLKRKLLAKSTKNFIFTKTIKQKCIFFTYWHAKPILIFKTIIIHNFFSIYILYVYFNTFLNLKHLQCAYMCTFSSQILFWFNSIVNNVIYYTFNLKTFCIYFVLFYHKKQTKNKIFLK